MPITIRQYQHEDKDTVLALHRAAFQQICGEYYEYTLEEVLHELSKNFCVVAIDNNTVIGAGTYTSVKEAFPYTNSSLKEWMQQIITFASNPSKREEAVQFYKDQFRPGSDPITLTYFNDEDTCKNIIVHDNDFYLSSVTIHPGFRRQSIGTALAKRRIEIAQQYGASAIYASCLESSQSPKILGKLGFLPLLRAGPATGNESAMIEMRLELQP